MARWRGRRLLPLGLALGWPLAFLPPMAELQRPGWPLEHVRGEPTSDDVLQALGCELWAVSSELLLAAQSLKSGELAVEGSGRPASQQRGPCTSHLPTVVDRSGSTLRRASEALMERRWRRAWAALEEASCSCQEHLPAQSWQGLVELIFARAELLVMGDCEAAAASLNGLGADLEKLVGVVEMHPDLQYPHRERACILLQCAGGLIRESAQLLEPETFYWPKDPRGKQQQEQRDSDGANNHDFGDFESDFEDVESVSDELPEDLLQGEASQRIEAFRREFAGAKGAVAKKRLLRRFLREAHPDHNPGKEAEVLPVFNYALKMMRVSPVGQRA